MHRGINEYTSSPGRMTDLKLLFHCSASVRARYHTEVIATRICTHDAEHVETETVTATAEITKQATCSALGETTYTGAPFENEAFEMQTVTLADVPTLVHTPVTDPAVEATCTATGLTEGSRCAVCGEVLVAQEVVPMKAHTYAIVPEQHATCEEAGFTSYVACTVCGHVLVAGSEIPALGHEWGEPEYIWSEDNSTVTATLTCTHDASHTQTETITAQLRIVSPTQTTEGELKFVSASFENEAFTVQEKTVGTIPALGTLSMPAFPASLTAIEDEAFEGTPFQAIIIPDTVTTIGSRAFANCRNLVYVYIPASVTSIAADAFADCPNAIIERASE